MDSLTNLVKGIKDATSWFSIYDIEKLNNLYGEASKIYSIHLLPKIESILIVNDSSGDFHYKTKNGLDYLYFQLENYKKIEKKINWVIRFNKILSIFKPFIILLIIPITIVFFILAFDLVDNFVKFTSSIPFLKTFWFGVSSVTFIFCILFFFFIILLLASVVLKVWGNYLLEGITEISLKYQYNNNNGKQNSIENIPESNDDFKEDEKLLLAKNKVVFVEDE